MQRTVQKALIPIIDAARSIITVVKTSENTYNFSMKPANQSTATTTEKIIPMAIFNFAVDKHSFWFYYIDRTFVCF